MSIDLHSHILPGIDDGACGEHEALDMLRIAAGDGTRTIVATPHADRIDHRQIVAGVCQLNVLAQDHKIDITILPGSEVRLSADLGSRFRAGTVTTLNHSPYVLIELPRGSMAPEYVSRAMFDLVMMGIRPILAHAERYSDVQRNPSSIADLVRSGVVIQINADSLMGGAGRNAEQTARLLVSSHLAHVIASDAHNVRQRPPRLAAAFGVAEQIAGSQYADLMARFASQVIRGEAIDLPEPRILAPPSLFSRVASRVLRRAV